MCLYNCANTKADKSPLNIIKRSESRPLEELKELSILCVLSLNVTSVNDAIPKTKENICARKSLLKNKKSIAFLDVAKYVSPCTA